MHPRCVGMGEMGLDYHYDNSPRVVQREILVRQLQCAVMLQKPLTIHTREADDDILPILKDNVPIEHPVSIALANLQSSLTSPIPPDTHSLLHRFPGAGEEFTRSLSQSLYRSYR